MDKNIQKNPKPSKYMYLRFSHFFDYKFHVFDIFLPPPKKKSDFLAKEPLKSFLSLFGQNSDNLDRFLVKFHSKLNIFIYHAILIFKLWQQQFSPKVTKLRPYHLNERTIRPWIQRRPWITSSAEPDIRDLETWSRLSRFIALAPLLRMWIASRIFLVEELESLSSIIAPWGPVYDVVFLRNVVSDDRLVLFWSWSFSVCPGEFDITYFFRVFLMSFQAGDKQTTSFSYVRHTTGFAWYVIKQHRLSR